MNHGILLALATLVLLTGCDPGFGSVGPSADCREAATQCILPTGPLGVCERSQCDPGDTPPCFQCTPQH